MGCNLEIKVKINPLQPGADQGLERAGATAAGGVRYESTPWRPAPQDYDPIPGAVLRRVIHKEVAGMQASSIPRGLRPQEVAVRLGLPLTTTYRLIHQGVIPAYRLGPRVLVVPEEELGRVLDRLRVRPSA